MMDTKETSITVRVPTYMKDFVTKKAKEAGMATGEFLRCMMFYDMLTAYTTHGYKKLARLRETYEVCGGKVPNSLIGEIMGGIYDDHDREIERIIISGIQRLSFDPSNTSRTDTMDNMVGDVISSTFRSRQVEESVDEEMSAKKPIVDGSDNEPKEVKHIPQVEQSVPQSHKPKKPKMGNTMSMI